MIGNEEISNTILKVQALVSNIKMYSNLLSTIPAFVCVSFLGPLSDQVSRHHHLQHHHHHHHLNERDNNFHNAIPTNDNMVQVGRKPCMLLPFIGHTFIAGVLIVNIITILIILIIAVIMNIKTMIIVGQTITIRVLITADTYCRC